VGENKYRGGKIRGVNMGQSSQQDYDDAKIDLGQYIKVLAKRKKTFIGIFLLIFAIGMGYVLSSPKIYRVSALLQPPVSGEVLTGANDIESAENLKGLIVNNAFNEALRKKMNLDQNRNDMEFGVIIPNKTNILQVSIDVESKKKEFGITALQSLVDLISESYNQRIAAKTAEIVSQIKFNERSIINAKEDANNLQEQIKEVASREDKLREEIRLINENTAQILSKREGLLKDNTDKESASILLLANYLQNNSSYLNQVNNQFSELLLRKVNLDFKLKKIDSQIINFQMAIEKLKISKEFISNLRILSQPRVSSGPVRPNKKKILVVSLVLGLFSGAFAVFLQEFWANNFRKV
jgi:uncharacterized protein involved in exopolysaccharide biosynthesis